MEAAASALPATCFVHEYGMAKRKRRERDRPKGGPEAVYNPNKRVLLSYASDDDAEAVEEKVEGGALENAQEDVPEDYIIAPYPEDELSSKQDRGYQNGGVNAEALEVSDGAEDEDALAPTTVSRKPASRIGAHPLTGQRPALGTIEYQWDDNDGVEDPEYDSEEAEAMAYLKAVRSERQAMPTIFRAQVHDEAESLYDNGIGDTRGWLSDGAYVARPVIGAVMPDSAKTRIKPQEAYTASLKQRFIADRAKLHATPDLEAFKALKKTQRTIAHDLGSKYRSEWCKTMSSVPPATAQVQSMDSTTVDTLLNLVKRRLLRRNRNIKVVTGAWIWSLLARLEDVGTMSNDEVYVLRELGKRAVLVQLSFDDPAAAQQLEQMAENADDDDDDEEEEQCEADKLTKVLDAATPSPPGSPQLNAAGAHVDRQTTTNNSEQPEMNVSAAEHTLITLDMIITVVGEVFGQRDLLEFRKSWESNDSVHENG